MSRMVRYHHFCFEMAHIQAQQVLVVPQRQYQSIQSSTALKSIIGQTFYDTGYKFSFFHVSQKYYNVEKHNSVPQSLTHSLHLPYSIVIIMCNLSEQRGCCWEVLYFFNDIYGTPSTICTLGFNIFYTYTHIRKQNHK